MKTEALILKERAQAQQYLDVAGVMIAVLDKTGKINLINKKGCQIHGYDENKILHQNWFDLCIHDDVREDIVGVFNKLMTGNIESVEYFENPIITKSGEQKIIAFHNTLIMDDDSNITGILFSGEDITERKHAEEALWESEARIRALLNAPTDAMILIDSAGIVLAVNNIHAEWLKKSIDEMIGKCVFDFFPSEIAEFRKAQTNEVFNTGKQIHFEESQNGKIFNTNVYPVFGAKGKVTAVAVYIQDITERKQAEEALRQSERDLKFRNQINSIFLSYPDEEMYAEILKLIRKAMESKYGTFGYFDENGYFVAPAVTRKIYWDKCNVPDKNIIFKKGTFGGIWGRAIKERKTLISNDGSFNTPKGHIHIENTMVTPIIFHDEVISAIHLANKLNGYDEQDRTVLETIADQIAPVLYARLQRDRKDMQRKQAEEALRVSEEKYKALYDNAPLSYQSLNEDGSFNDVNPAWIRTLGYNRKEVIGKWFGDFLHPDWKPHLEKNFQEFKRRGYVHDVQFKIRHKDGHYLDISFEGYIGYNPDGSFKQTYCVFQDITERKQAEEALTNALGEWRVTFDSANDLIMMLDADFKIRRANLATERFLNRPIKEITGKTCYQLFHGTDRPPEGCPLENMRNTKKHEEKEFYLPEKDIWILASVDPILDDKGNVTGAVHIIRDITERKLAKEKLLKERALLNAIIDNIPVLLTRYDPDANMLYLNKEFENKIGWKTEEVIDIDMMEKVYPDPDYRQQALEYMQKASTEWREFQVQSKSGKVIDSEWSNIQLEDGTQIGIGIDITERKQADEALRLHAAMMDNVAEGIYLTGLDDLIIKWTNEKFEKMFGYDPGEMVGKQVDIVNAPTERTPTETRINIVDVLKKTGEWHGEVMNMKHDGTHFWCYANVSLFDHPKYGKVIVSVHTDITERKHAEKMLQRSEALLNATQQLSKVGGWEWNVETQTMFWTDEVYRIHDFQPSEFTPGSIEHIEQSIECYDPEDRPVIMEAFRNCAENGQAYDLEFPFTTSMGRQRWIRTVANPVLKDKRIVKVVGNMMDITERKQAEDALRESEAMMKSIFRAAPTGIGVVLNRKIQFVNQTFIEMLGYSKEELIGQNSRMVYPSNEEFDKVGKYKYEQIRKYGTGTIETQLLRKDGRLIDVLLNSTPIDLNDLSKGVTFTATDITERKQAEEEIRLHAAMMDNVAEGVYLIGLDDLLIKWTNEKFTRMFGYDPGEMVGKQVDIVNAPTEMTPTETRISIVDILKETGEWHGEIRNIKRDGTHFWCYANVSLFDHPEYGMVIVSAHTDITERKKLEDELARSEKQMSAAIEAARGFTFSYDIATGKINWGGAIEKVTGYTLEELAQVDIDGWAERIHPDDRDEVLSIMDEAIHKKDRATAEYRFKTKKGGYVILSSISRTEKENGKPVRLVGILQDITERLQTEKELQERINELETFYRTTLGREERVIELKQEVNELLEQLGKNNKYRDYS